MERKIKVEVLGGGLFSSERTVGFGTNGSRISLLVDVRQIHDDKITVRVLDEVGDDAIVDLPSEAFSSGSRVRIPKNLLL